jgi:HK97 family phage portal protein
VKSSVRRVFRGQSGPRVQVNPQYNTSGFLSGFRNQDRATMLQAMTSIGDVYGQVSLVASAVARTHWTLYRKTSPDGRRRYTTADHGDDQRVQVTRHAALDLWNRPIKFLTQRAFLQGTQQHMELTGEGYWVFQRVPGFSTPLNMIYVRPDRMEAVPGDGFLAGWIYTDPNGQKVPLQVEEVIGPPSMVIAPDPLNIMHGISPLQSVMTDIQAASYAMTWNRNFFYNDARPGGVIDTNAPTMTDKQFKEFTSRWRESHKGISAAGAVAVLENGAKFTAVSPNMRDMQFAELRTMARDNIRRGWRIQPSLMGDVEDVNRANAETAQESFNRDIVSERLDIVKDVLNGPYLDLFSAADQVEFDYADPVPENREADNSELTAKANAFAQFVSNGMDPHDALELAGLPDANFDTQPELAEPATPDASTTTTEPDAGQAAMARAFREIADQELEEMTEALARLSNGHKAGAL